MSDTKDAAVEGILDRNTNLELFRVQLRRWKSSDPEVECAGCPKKIRRVYLYRCLYCSLWFCKTCAMTHFGPNEVE